MIASTRFLFALVAGLLLSLPSPASAADPGGYIYQAFTDRSRVVQISILFVVAGYFFLRGNVRR